MAKISYRERIQSKIRKGRRYMDEVHRKPGTSFQSPLPVESHRMCLIPPVLSCDNTCEMLSPKKLIRDSVPNVFMGSSYNRHSLPTMHHNSRLPEEKQVFGINHSVCLDSLSTVSPSYQLRKSRNIPGVQIPR